MKSKLQKILIMMLLALSCNTSVFAKELVPSGCVERISYVIKKFGPMPKMMAIGIVMLAVMIVVTVVYYNKNWRDK